MLRGIFHGMKLAAPLLVLATASQLFAADAAKAPVAAKQNTTAVVPSPTPANGAGAVTKSATPTTKATTSQQTVRRYHRHHRRGYGRRYVGATQSTPRQNMPSKNVTAGKQFSSKASGNVATPPVKHHNTTTQKAPQNTHKTSHKHAKASTAKKA